MRRGGFTVIELLVAITIVAVLVSLALMTVQRARESARRVQCVSHLHQIGVAIESYHSMNGMFPPGNANAYSFHVAVLPHIGQAALFRTVDHSLYIWDPVNDELRRSRPPLFACPSDPSANLASGESGVLGTNYVGNAGTGVQNNGYDGMFQPFYPPNAERRHGPVRAAMVHDGLSHTAAISEVLIGNGTREALRVNWWTPQALPRQDQLEQFANACRNLDTSSEKGDLWQRGRTWIEGDNGMTWYNHILTPNQKSCYNGTWVPGGAYTAASLHGDGVNVLMADGSVRFTSASIDLTVWRALGTRDGGEAVNDN